MSGPVGCTAPSCPAPAKFRFYDRETDRWRPLCDQHALELHPSLELHALLESGYMKPVEVEAPTGPPEAPPTPRGEAFREIVEDLLGWDDA